MNDHGHTSVLLYESIDGLAIHAGDIYVDGTVGSGGHAEEVARRFGKTIRIIGIDADADALTRSKARLEKLEANVELVQGNFRNLDTILDSLHIEKVNRILLDIGLSSNQLEESGRGFSFLRNEPLHMTFAKDIKEGETTAALVVNEWSEETLVTIFKGFGEERYARQIAREIVEAREIEPITTTGQLVDIIQSSVPVRYQKQKIHFATRTFQAIRIAVNQELEVLREGIMKGFDRLAPGGRMAVISFHSLEDRIVKTIFKTKAESQVGTRITKKPIIASAEERDTNRRSRSAKLRIIEKKS
jgi:16S rRNA (cytosine1402-N4)-methyltransferase